MFMGIILLLAFYYGYLNGQIGSASIVATMISSRSISPRLAFWLAAVGICIGPVVLGTAVAATIGEDFLRPGTANMYVVIATLMGAVLWCSLTLWLKVPVSISQALIGALIGSAWAGFGHEAIAGSGLSKTFIGLFISPILGLMVGYGLVQFCYAMSAAATPHLNLWLRRGQVLASFLMAIAFGSNDAQKLMGIVVLGLIAGGVLNSFDVPLWVVMFSTAAIGLGTIVGGWRLIHTMGGKFYKIRPIHGFGAQVASTGVIFASAVLGWPISGSQVVASAIVGAGSADRIQKVRWMVVQRILVGWLLTLPLSAFAGALIYLILKGVAP